MHKETHGWHGQLALEATPDPVINTLGFSPGLLHTMVAIRLVAPIVMDRESDA